MSEIKNELTIFDNGGWQRNFPGEKIPILERVFSQLTATQSALNADARQARFVDTNFYYRLGGVDPDKAKANNDILAVQWGIGSRRAETYLEQIQIAKDQGIPYISWWIPDPADNLSMTAQVDNMIETPGVLEAPIFVDAEPPRATTRCINASELQACVTRIGQVSAFFPGCYSRVNIFEGMFGSTFPDWMAVVNQWIAQYPYIPGTTVYCSTYEDFLADWAWRYPPAVLKSKLYVDPGWRSKVLAWQFSPKGIASRYIAPLVLPDGSPAIKSCDLNVSMMDVDSFLRQLFQTIEQPEPPVIEPEPIDCTWEFEALKDVNYRNAPVVSTSTYLGTIQKGTIIKASGMSNPASMNLWLEFEKDGLTRYTAFVYGGIQYYKPV